MTEEKIHRENKFKTSKISAEIAKELIVKTPFTKVETTENPMDLEALLDK